MCRRKKIIYDTVIYSKPNICVECGTWKGGGSTFFIANAILENKIGKLYTYETNLELFNFALNFYKDKPLLKENIEFCNNDFLEGIKQLTSINFALLDGPDIPEYTLNQVLFLENVMQSNNFVIVHDWKIEKCNKLQPYLKSKQNKWKIKYELNNTLTGMCCFQKI